MRNQSISWAWLLTQAKEYKARLITANIIAVMATVLSVPIPLLMPLMVDEVLLKQPAEGIQFINQFLPGTWQKPVAYIIVIFVIIVLMRILSQSLNILQSRQFTLISKTITLAIRQKLLNKLGRISIQEYEARGSGGLNSHLVTDVETIDQFIGSTLSKFIVSFLTVLGTAFILLWINWKLGLFILLINPIVVYLSRQLGKRVKDLKRQENKAFERFQNALIETLDGIYQLRAANRERAYLAKLNTQAESIKISAGKYAWQSEAAGRFSFLLFLLGFELFRAVAMIMVISSDLSIGQMFAVFGYLWFMLSPVQELLNIQFSWYSASAAINRINSLLILKEEARPESKVNPFINNDAIDINVNNIDFSYQTDNDTEHQSNILNQLSLHIRAGERTALVGASGGGKSTLIQLLIGVYQQQKGQILFNGETTTDISFDVIRDNIAVVLQQPILFNDTLRNNLSLSVNYTDQQIWQAIEIAQLSELVNKLDNGLDTQLGRQGLRLSGGQRQRLAIARMVLTNPKFVILDEATSALDTHTEAKLHHALNLFLKGRTTLIVAHRLSAIKQADHIYVLEDGKVSQCGTHKELVQQDGLYQTLYGSVQT